MSTSADLVRNARASYQEVSRTPRRRTAVVTCIDTRLDPLRMLQARPGDLHIFRNAGGVVTDDVLRSLVVSTHEFGVTRVELIMHTDCGMLRIDEATIEADLGRLPFDLHGFADLDEELARGADRLRSESLLHLPGGVATHVYDISDGRLHRQKVRPQRSA